MAYRPLARNGNSGIIRAAAQLHGKNVDSVYPMRPTAVCLARPCVDQLIASREFDRAYASALAEEP